MRALQLALALSATLHAGALAWVHTHPSEDIEDKPQVAPEPIEIVQIVPTEPTPMTVTLLDDHTVVPAAPGASRPSHSRAPVSRQSVSRQSVSRTTGTQPEVAAATTTLVPPSTQSEQKPRPSLLTMRKPDLEVTPDSDFTARFLRNSRPLQPKDIKTEQLQSELAASNDKLDNPRWIANATPEQVTGERMTRMALRDELNNRELKPDGTGTKSEHETFKIKVAVDGTAKIQDKANLQRKGLLSGSFDVTDAMMRSQGMDPYASYKLKVLDETREERVAIGKRHRTQQLAQSRQHMQKNIDQLFAMTADVAQLKQGLFELWDDCAETGSAEVIAGGTAARLHVVGVIRSRLPEGSASAFTAADIERLNKQRKSGTRFAPY